MIKGLRIAIASVTIGLSAFSFAFRRKPVTARRWARVWLGLGSEQFLVARSVRARSTSFRLLLLRPSIMGLWLMDRHHGRQAGMTTARGAIRASTRKRDISSVRMGHPISAASALNPSRLA
jgi:hypothetical protein